MKDPYDVLGVSRGITAEALKLAFHKLARELHPDLHPNDRAAEDRFKDISAAYDLLSDPERRGRFDRGEINASGTERRRWRSARPAPEPRPDPKQGKAEPKSQERSADKEQDWTKQDWGQQDAKAETKTGKSRSGFGAGVDDILKDLLRRKAKGRAKYGSDGKGLPQERGEDQSYHLRVNFIAAATGTSARLTLNNGRSVDVRVPAGTADGSTLRLRSLGGEGKGGGEAGDALVEIQVTPHPLFSRKDRDLVLSLPVTLPEVVLGAKVTIPTLNGKVAVTIPPASNGGTVLRLKGKGIAGGDLLVTLALVLPETIDNDLTNFARKWGSKHPYNPRAKMDES